MDCYLPGRVLLSPEPEFGDLGDIESNISERIGLPFEVEYSVRDILARYEIEGSDDRGIMESSRLPVIARIPEGAEDDAAYRLVDSKYVQAACPDYASFPQANVSIDDAVIDDAIAYVNGNPPENVCGAGCTVAILDTGVDASHLRTPGALMSQQYDVDDPYNNGATPHDARGHGSLVAHIVNAIAPSAEIQSIRTMRDSGSLSGVLTGLYLAAEKSRCDLINLSLSINCRPGRCPKCKWRTGAAGNAAQVGHFFDTYRSFHPETVIIAAAGNGYGHVSMPASLDGIIAIGDFDHAADTPSQNSAYQHVPSDRYIMAPGSRNIRKKAFGERQSLGRPALQTGTSFAAAFATGIAARYICARKGGPCAVSSVPSTASSFDHIRARFARSAYRGFSGYDPATHGLGVLKYAR